VSGTFDADTASCASYDTVGFDADTVDIVHPWALVPHDEPVLGHVFDVGVATCSRRMNLDSDGTFVFRSPFKTGYADPDPILTVTAAVDMVSVIEERQGNKLVIHGVDYVKTDRAVKIWDAEGSGLPSTSTHAVYATVAFNEVFPENVKSAVFWMEWLH